MSVQKRPYLTPFLSEPTLSYVTVHVRHGLVLSLSGFPPEKLAKVGNHSQALSEFDCTCLVLRYRCFLKANFNVQFDDQFEFYNVTV